MSGLIDPHAAATEYQFEYGPTTEYGSATALANVGSGDVQVPVTAVIGDIAPGTTYHYRLVAFSAGGASYGADETFTTSPQPGVAVQSPSSSPTKSGAIGTVAVEKAISVRGRSARLTLRCRGAGVTRCTGIVELAERTKAGHLRLLGKANFTLHGGQTATVEAKIGGSLASMLRRAVRPMRVEVVVEQRGRRRFTQSASVSEVVAR